MYLLERKIETKQTFVIGANDMRFTNQPNINVNYWYNAETETFFPTNDGANSKIFISPRMLTFKGGIVADDVGLGKTLTMLSLMASHPFRGDITATSFTNEGKVEPGPDKNSCTITTAATLVIAPSHVVDQWHNQLKKHFVADLINVIKITVSKEYENITYNGTCLYNLFWAIGNASAFYVCLLVFVFFLKSDILNAQLVLLSAQFVGNRSFKTSGAEELRPLWMQLNPDSAKEMNTESSRAKTRRSEKSLFDLHQCAPNLNFFHWYRIILDEAPDYCSNRTLFNRICYFSSSFRWYLSGTPFPTRASVAACAQFLQIAWADSEAKKELGKSTKKKEMWTVETIDRPIGYVLHSILHNHLFSRHTESSVGKDDFLPDVMEGIYVYDIYIYIYIYMYIYGTLCLRFLFFVCLFGKTYALKSQYKCQQKLERKLCAGLYSHFEHSFVDYYWKFSQKTYEHYFIELYERTIEKYERTLSDIEAKLEQKKQYVRQQLDYKKGLDNKKKNFWTKAKFGIFDKRFLQVFCLDEHDILQKKKRMFTHVIQTNKRGLA
ncbi:hypothetical protein RFI_27700 [Reticulomyxa filosa]|uniref:SNF2 N-terminal domain-containing protein n=1 Tax=Reticulomyxa filosa TaxID=46433 RepID=X6M6X8_RETFI|nr:hypothetical protein RFI_27700 [Reticulomyxa filosa]|eukprot:ETO09679.1 hypothetical protein RFI_27700 [Reticulomyxa filosa]